MRKAMKISCVIAASAAACMLAACGSRGKGRYDTLNKMLAAHYSEIVLTVTDTFDEDTYLTSEYTFAYPTEDSAVVHYTVERFGELSLDGGQEKVILTGSALISGGELVYTSGDDIGIPESFATKGFAFRAEYFENAQLTASAFSADVKDVSAFLGCELSCSDMKVAASFADAFESLLVTFTAADGSAVEYRYEFTV